MLALLGYVRHYSGKHGRAIFGRMSPIERATYRVQTFDVWGNARDGFNINDAFWTGETVEMPTNSDERAVIAHLKAEGLIRRDCRPSRIDVEREELGWFISDALNGRPEMRLVRE